MHSRKRSCKQSAPVITYSSHPQHPVPEVSNVNVNEINTTKSPSLKDLQNYYSSEFCSIANLAKQAIPLEHRKAQAWRNEICLITVLLISNNSSNNNSDTNNRNKMIKDMI